MDKLYNNTVASPGSVARRGKAGN